MENSIGSEVIEMIGWRQKKILLYIMLAPAPLTSRGSVFDRIKSG